MGYLKEAEQAELDARRRTDPSVDEVLRQLDRIWADGRFDRATKAKDVLGFTAAMTLLGRVAEIKELTIAMAVWPELTDYDPFVDHNVRMVAADIRRKLPDYYANEGRHDPIEIRLPDRGYVPEIIDRHVSVGAFENWNATNDQDHLCKLTRDEIIYRLAHVGRVRAGVATDLASDAQSARYAVRGSLESRGNVLRVNVSVCDHHAGTIILSQAFEGDRDDVVKLSRGAAEAVVDAVSTGVPGHANGRNRPERFQTLQLYQQGRFHMRRRIPADIRRAMELFEQAIEADPNNARAYSGLADSHLVLTWYELSTPDRGWFETGKTLATIAVELGPRLPETHTSLGYAKVLCDFDWAGAEDEFCQAIRLANRYPPTHHWYANLLTMQGRFKEAEDEMKRAFHLDPGSIVIRKTLGDPYYYSGRYPEAIESYTAALKLDPSFWMTHLFLGFAYEQLGDADRALQEFDNAATHTGLSSIVQGAIGHLYAKSGREGKAREILTQLQERVSSPYVAPHTLAVIYAGLGDKDQAFEWLNASYQSRIELVAWIKVDPRFESLRDDRRFDQFLAKLSLISPRPDAA